MAAIELVLDALQSSFPFQFGEGDLHPRDVNAAFERLEYLQPRVAAVFQQKIGVATNSKAAEEVALLGAVLLLNKYHFADIGLPVKGNLRLSGNDQAADVVAKGERNLVKVVCKLKEFQAYLRGHGFFHEAALKVSRYLAILDKEPNDPDAGDGK